MLFKQCFNNMGYLLLRNHRLMLEIKASPVLYWGLRPRAEAQAGKNEVYFCK